MGFTQWKDQEPSQIDYINRQQHLKSCFKNCRVLNSGYVYSDHSLLVAIIEIKLHKVKKLSTVPKKYDIYKLKDKDIAETFEQRLGGRFEYLLELNEDIDDLYDQFKPVTNNVTQEIVGFRRNKQVEGISKEFIELCEKRRRARQEFLINTDIPCC